MVAFWRQAGLNYVQFSRVCARVVRQSLKQDYKAEAAKREVATIRAIYWKEGKPVTKENNQA